jgi:hypothetical protein
MEARTVGVVVAIPTEVETPTGCPCLYKAGVHLTEFKHSFTLCPRNEPTWDDREGLTLNQRYCSTVSRSGPVVIFVNVATHWWTNTTA